MGVWRWLLSRRKNNWELAEDSDKRVRLSQDMMEQTIARLHLEIETLREDHEQALDRIRAEFLEASSALWHCERERLRLRVRLTELGEEDP